MTSIVTAIFEDDGSTTTYWKNERGYPYDPQAITVKKWDMVLSTYFSTEIEALYNKDMMLIEHYTSKRNSLTKNHKTYEEYNVLIRRINIRKAEFQRDNAEYFI